MKKQLLYGKKHYFSVIILALLIMISTFASSAMACTGFFYTRNGKTLIGNTEDWLPMAGQVRSYQATADEYGRVYLGFPNPTTLFTTWMPFAGINDQGLMFDIFLVPKKIIPYDTDKLGRKDALDMMKELIKTCSTVAEVRAELEKYNPSYLMMTGMLGLTDGYQLFIADKNGNSLVYGGGEFFESSDYQAVANSFYDVSFSIGTHNSYYRYTSAVNMMENLDQYLSDNPGLELTVDYFLPILTRVDVETGSMYSTMYAYIMDLTEGLIYIYTPSLESIHSSTKYMNYINSTVIDVAEKTAQPSDKCYLKNLPYDNVHSDSGLYAGFDDQIDTLSSGDYIMYAPIDVIPGSNLNINMTGTGDADLYVVFDRSVDDDWDYRSIGSSSDEHLDITVPLYSAQAYIIIEAYKDSSDLDLSVDYYKSSYIPSSSGKVIVNYEDHEVDRNDKIIYGPFDVKTGTQFIARTEPGSRNADLYVYFAKSRTNYILGGQSKTWNSEESVEIDSVPDTMEISPGQTIAYVVVEGRWLNSGYNLSIEYVKP